MGSACPPALTQKCQQGLVHRERASLKSKPTFPPEPGQGHPDHSGLWTCPVCSPGAAQPHRRHWSHGAAAAGATRVLGRAGEQTNKVVGRELLRPEEEMRTIARTRLLSKPTRSPHGVPGSLRCMWARVHSSPVLGLCEASERTLLGRVRSLVSAGP